jgi:hypothetical protein
LLAYCDGYSCNPAATHKLGAHVLPPLLPPVLDDKDDATPLVEDDDEDTLVPVDELNGGIGGRTVDEYVPVVPLLPPLLLMKIVPVDDDTPVLPPLPLPADDDDDEYFAVG